MSSLKKISFVVPCYNSESYMDRCINSLLSGGDEVEIIIVNDGSKDNTGQIADSYQQKYPNIVKVIHKENGGHGSGVNAGLKIAKGLYFKVVDSDDWLDEASLITLLKNINKSTKKPDLIVCNYVYNTLKSKKIMKFENVFPLHQECTWEDIKFFHPSQYLIMHSLIYKTTILKKCKLNLPTHTFYVDNIVAYQPLPFVKTITYYDLDLYQYFIGREDQSVNEKVMIKRVDQQLKVTKIILDSVNLDNIKSTQPKLYQYMTRFVSMMITISSIYLLMKGDSDSYDKRRKLWNYVKKVNKNLYHKLRLTKLAGATYILPGKLGGYVTLKGYKLAQKVYKFN